MNDTNSSRAVMEDTVRLPSKGPLSVHQRALLVLWVSAMCMMLLRRIFSFSGILDLFQKLCDGKS